MNELTSLHIFFASLITNNRSVFLSMTATETAR
ncbi:hypothetical protein NFJ02_07g131860 [Pycnococcus provasolii]